MNRIFPSLAAVLLLAIPVASAQGTFTAQEVEGAGIGGESPNAWVLLGPGGGRITMSGEVEVGELAVHDDYSDTSLSLPGSPPGALLSGLERNTTTQRGTPASFFLREITHGNAKVLLLPASVSAYRAHFIARDFSAVPASNERLEASHAIPEDATPRPPEYYEFVTGDTLNVSLAGATLRIEGDILVYFWGSTFTFLGEAGPKTFQTGNFTSPTVGGRNEVAEVHYVHALLLLRNGRVDIATGSANLYGDFEVNAESSVYREADGSVPLSSGGAASVTDGTIEVDGGTTSWTSDGREIRATFLTPADRAGGPTVQTIGPTLWGGSNAWLWLAAGLAGVGLLGMVLTPSALATEGRTWRQRRASGFNRLRGWAEGRGQPKVAGYCARRAASWDPLDSRHPMNAAAHALDAGQPLVALAWHRRAAATFRASPDPDDEAQNAYHGARAAARAGLEKDALEWLRIALQSVPGLAQDAAHEPDFARISTHPEFLSLMGA